MIWRYFVVPQLFLIKNDQVLLLYRENTKMMDGYWSAISGKIEEGESPMAMLVREAEEEVGVVLSELQFNNCVAHQSPQYLDPENIFLGMEIFFTSRVWVGDPVNKEPHKHGDVKWFDLNQIPENTMPSVKEAILSLIDGRLYSEANYINDR